RRVEQNDGTRQRYGSRALRYRQTPSGGYSWENVMVPCGHTFMSDTFIDAPTQCLASAAHLAYLDWCSPGPEELSFDPSPKLFIFRVHPLIYRYTLTQFLANE